MYTNIQSKTTQIKSKKLNSFGTLKKIKSKDTLISKQKNIGRHQSQEKSKGKGIGLKQQLPNANKLKDHQNTKKIQQEYYMQQKHASKAKKISQIEKYLKNRVGCITGQSNTKSHKKLSANKGKKDEANSKTPKLRLPDSKVVINFDGKLIKMPPNGCETKNHNYTSISNSQYALTERQISKYYRSKGKSKSKSKQKWQKKSGSGTSSILETQNKNKHCISQQYINTQNSAWEGFQYEMKHKNNLLAEQTQISPLRQNKQYQRNEIFDFQQIYELIEEDLENCNEIKISQHVSKHRRQCIQMMSQLCGQILLRRETFYLAISIFDRAVSKKINNTNYILIALVSLTLAMKLEQAQLSLEFIYVLGVISTGKQSYLQSVQSNKSSSKQKSVDRQNSKHKKSLKKFKLNFKAEDVRKINTSGIVKILKKYNCNKISKIEFMQLEQKITIYLRFRLWRIQAIYWADLLTCMWDQNFMNNELHKSYNSCLLLFRYPTSLTNLSYLYQILEMAYANETVYEFPSIYVVLSTMYLLMRISKQNHENGFEFYRKSLANSTNILFVDTTGVNQIFWSFLEKLQIEMAQILACCQFISKYLQPQLMKTSITYEQSKDSVDNQLCIHQFNPDLYKDIIQ